MTLCARRDRPIGRLTGRFAAAAAAAAVAGFPALGWAKTPMAYTYGFGTKAYPVVNLLWGAIILSLMVIGIVALFVLVGSLRLYPFYADGAAAWGLTQLEDQQLAGIVMWIPGGFVWVVAASLVFVKWLQQAERQTQMRMLARRVVLPALVLILLPGLLAGCGNNSDPPGPALSFGGDRAHGAALIRAYGCGACHTIPGVLNANGLVGPPLTQMGRRIYIAGLLRNTPGNMIAWIRNPQRFVPGVVMPDMGVTARDARDIAAYLESLR